MLFTRRGAREWLSEMRMQVNLWRTAISLLLTTASLLASTSTMGSVICPGPATVQGVDVSQFHGTPNWNAVGASGIHFAFANVSYGTQVDPSFDRNYAAIKAAG